MIEQLLMYLGLSDHYSENIIHLSHSVLRGLHSVPCHVFNRGKSHNGKQDSMKLNIFTQIYMVGIEKKIVNVERLTNTLLNIASELIV